MTLAHYRRLTALIGLLTAGCTGDLLNATLADNLNKLRNSANRPPVVAAFTANPTNAVAPGGQITCKLEARDPDGDPISYTWSAKAGTLSTTVGNTVTWQAPTVPGTYQIEVQLDDGKGSTTKATQSVTVSADGAASLPPDAIPTPTPITTSLPDMGEGTSRDTVHGIIFDDQAQRLSDVTVTGLVLGGDKFANGSDTLVVTSQVGSYALNGVPCGETILITVSKAGYTTRQQTIVPMPNLEGNPDVNKVDFGDATPGEDVFGMSDKPEVITMSPAPDATGVDPGTSFTLTFSEPMNTADIENQLAIAVASTNGSPLYLSSNGIQLGEPRKMYQPNTDLVGSDAFIGSDEYLYDTSALTFAWSNNNQTVTATFRLGYKLPTDRDASRVPQYALGLKGSLRDATGIKRDERWFRVSPAQMGKNAYRFSVSADTTPPKLLSIMGIKTATGDGVNRIRVQFSETMLLFPQNLAGGVQSIPQQSPSAQAATNPSRYHYAIGTEVSAINTPASTVAPTRLWASDATNATVEIPLSDSTNFIAGARAWVLVASDVTDPAGNALDISNNGDIKSGMVI